MFAVDLEVVAIEHAVGLQGEILARIAEVALKHVPAILLVVVEIAVLAVYVRSPVVGDTNVEAPPLVAQGEVYLLGVVLVQAHAAVHAQRQSAPLELGLGLNGKVALVHAAPNVAAHEVGLHCSLEVFLCQCHRRRHQQHKDGNYRLMHSFLSIFHNVIT